MKYQYLLLCLFIPLFSHAQYGLATSEQYTVASNSKMKLNIDTYGLVDEGPGSSKKRKGKTFMIIGGALLVTGTILFAGSDGHVSLFLNEDKNNGTYGAADQGAELAVLVSVAGVGLLVPGVILYSKGKKQLKQYEAQKTVSLHMQGAGVALRLKL